MRNKTYSCLGETILGQSAGIQNYTLPKRINTKQPTLSIDHKVSMLAVKMSSIKGVFGSLIPRPPPSFCTKGVSFKETLGTRLAFP